MLSRYFNKARVQIEDIIWKKDLRAVLHIALSVLNRRRIPLPAAFFKVFNRVDEDSSDTDMGDENFLAPYMVPDQNKCFVDVGASIGGWSLFVAQRGNTVYAFEPSPKAYHALAARIKKYPNIHAYPYALGDEDTVGRLGFAATTLSGTMDAEITGLQGGGTMDITVHKLDSLHLTNVGVIKIDTEGYETPILQGAKETIEKNKPLLIIEVHKATGRAMETFSEELHKITQILQGFDYTWVVCSRQVNLRELQPFVIAKPKGSKVVISNAA